MAKPLTSLIGYLKRIDELKKSTPKDNSLYFRGHSSKDYKLEPALYRNDKTINNEDKLYKELILDNPNEFIDDTTTLEKLVRMQHFSMPTRILDLTENPLVALYFTCKSKPEHHGEVIALSIPKEKIKYYDSDAVSILSNLCKLRLNEKKFDTNLKFEDFNKEENVYKLVHAIREEKPYFERWIKPKDLNGVFCVRAKRNNRRIIAQSGLFLIFGIGEDEYKVSIPDFWLPYKDNRGKILIDKDSKNKLIEELALINITENTLFPDIEKSAQKIVKDFT